MKAVWRHRRGTPGIVVLLVMLLLAVTARGGDSVLVFNEVHYHPANEATQTEWVELRSLQAVDVDIGKWRIEGNVAPALALEAMLVSAVRDKERS